jgi:hypothetical protein
MSDAGTILTQATELIQQCQSLYAGAAAEYIQQSPRAVEKPSEFRSQIQDLLRGLILKVLHGAVLVDKRLSSGELELCQRLFAQLWDRYFTPQEARAVLVKHSEQEGYRWEDLLWPFERLSPFQQRANKLEAHILQLVQIIRQIDGNIKAEETQYIHWLKGELNRVLHPIKADVTESPEPVRMVGKKTAQQVQTEQKQAEQMKPLPVPAELLDFNTLLTELDSLIGLAAVKRDINELVHFLNMQKQRTTHGLPVTSISLHAIFTGNPGTGKTTVARLYGKLLGTLGLLKKGHLVETDRGGLVAEYAGQTATKTNARIDEALDGVLFIDEAYSLVNEGEDPYGAEAVQTLLKRMEDQRDRLVVILAGYPEPMENLLCTNPGLASRFSRTLVFDDYTPVELCRIFQIFCMRDQYQLPAITRAQLIEGFTWHWTRRDERFGNGRLARNLYEASLRRLATRLARAKGVDKRLLSTLEHLDLAFDAIPVAERTGLVEQIYSWLCLGCATSSAVTAQQLGTSITCGGCQREQVVEWGEIVKPPAALA